MEHHPRGGNYGIILRVCVGGQSLKIYYNDYEGQIMNLGINNQKYTDTANYSSLPDYTQVKDPESLQTGPRIWTQYFASAKKV